MAKRQFTKSQFKARSQLKIRELPPKLRPIKGGGAEILCPFCDPPHPLLPGQDAACGTMLKVTAIQTVVPARVARNKKLVCVKCHKNNGGDLVRYQNGLIHLEDCMPGTKLLVAPPKFSASAKLVFGMPKWMRKQVEKITGAAKQVNEIDPEGKDTGKVLGYFFYKPQTG